MGATTRSISCIQGTKLGAGGLRPCMLSNRMTEPHGLPCFHCGFVSAVSPRNETEENCEVHIVPPLWFRFKHEALHWPFALSLPTPKSICSFFAFSLFVPFLRETVSLGLTRKARIAMAIHRVQSIQRQKTETADAPPSDAMSRKVSTWSSNTTTSERKEGRETRTRTRRGRRR